MLFLSVEDALKYTNSSILSTTQCGKAKWLAVFSSPWIVVTNMGRPWWLLATSFSSLFCYTVIWDGGTFVVSKIASNRGSMLGQKVLKLVKCIKEAYQV